MIRIEHNGVVLRLFGSQDDVPIVADWTPVPFECGWLAFDGTFFHDSDGVVPADAVSVGDIPELKAIRPPAQPTGRRYSSVQALVAAECSPEVQAAFHKMRPDEPAAGI